MLVFFRGCDNIGKMAFDPKRKYDLTKDEYEKVKSSCVILPEPKKDAPEAVKTQYKADLKVAKKITENLRASAKAREQRAKDKAKGEKPTKADTRKDSEVVKENKELKAMVAVLEKQLMEATETIAELEKETGIDVIYTDKDGKEHEAIQIAVDKKLVGKNMATIEREVKGKMIRENVPLKSIVEDPDGEDEEEEE